MARVPVLKTTLFALCLGFFASAPAYAQEAQSRFLQTDAVLADIDLAEEAYARIHPGYTRYASEEDMASAWDALRTSASDAGGLSVAELYLGVQDVLVGIRCDHTKAELPRPLADERKTQPVYLPIGWRWVEDRAIITAPNGIQDVLAGDEILKIDGRPIGQIVSEVAAYLPYDGHTEWSRNRQISDSREFMGGAVDHFGALLAWPESQARLSVQRGDQDAREVMVDRVSFTDFAALRDAAGSVANFKDAVEFEVTADGIAVLRIDTFVNYRDPVKPDDIYNPIFKQLSDENVGTLILDLRNNGGGSSDAQMELLSYLLDRRRALYTDMRVATLDLDDLREHLWTWDSRALDPNPLGFSRNNDGTYSLRRFVSDELKQIRPKRHAFKGELVILTSDANSSASTTLAAFLAEHRGAVLVGEETGGSAEGPTAGLQFTLTLPESGITTSVPFIRYPTNISALRIGYGVKPDIEAPVTIDTLRNEADPALDAALAYIREQR